MVLFMVTYLALHTIDGKVNYFLYLALGITLWNSIADAMAIGSRDLYQ